MKVEKKEVSEPINLRNFFFGPTLILFGLGFGAGELLLWPQIAGTYGFAFVWMCFFSLLIQTLWTLEIVKITLITGEHFVLYMARIFGLINSILIFTILTFLAAGIPSWAVSSAESLVKIYNFSLDYKTALFIWSVITYLLVFVSITFSGVVSKMLEKFFKFVTLVTWIFLIFIIAELKLYNNIFEAFVSAFTNFGSFRFDISMWTLASAVAFVGAGGIFNMWYTYWVRDFGWGMAKYVGSIKGLLKKQEKIRIDPIFPKEDLENLRKLSLWVRNVKIGFFSVYFGLNFLTLLVFISLGYLMLGNNVEPSQIPYKISEYIGKNLGEIFGFAYLLFLALQLFSTQYSITEGLVRQISDSIYIYLQKRKKKDVEINKIYFKILLFFLFYSLAWIYLTKISEFLNPDFLIKLSANIALIFQIFSIPLVLYFNTVIARKFLSYKIYKIIQPSILTIVILMLGFLFYLYLSIQAWQELFTQ